MGKVEAIILWVAIFGYSLSFIFYVIANVFKWEKGNLAGMLILVFSFIFHTLAISIRWLETGHPPVIGGFENNLAGAWFVILLTFFLNRWFKKANIIGLIMIPFAMFMLGNSLMAKARLEPQTPNYNSNWLWVHVTFAWLAYSSFAVAGGLSLVYLIKDRWSKSNDNFFLGHFPETKIIEDVNLKFITFGLISQTIMLISGSIWANSLWGSYWSWDLLETWALVNWLLYAVILHLRFTLGWKGNRIAWLTVIALFAVVITFFGIGFISKLHTPLLR